MLDLPSICPPQTDYPESNSSLDKCDVIKRLCFMCESDHSYFAVFKTVINPNESRIPIEFTG